MTLDGRQVPVAPDGRFIIGVDRDAPPSLRLVARTREGREAVQTLTVAARAWPIQRIDMARPSTGPTPEYARLRESEQVRIGAARQSRSASAGWPRLILPARGPDHGRSARTLYRGCGRLS